MTTDATTAEPSGPLSGFVIGVTADRRADEQMDLLRGRGALCLAGPMIKTHAIDDPAEIRRATQSVIDDDPDFAIFTTGIGVRSWLEAADSLQLGVPLLNKLRQTKVIARGPKAVGALYVAGLDIDWNAPDAQYASVLAHLAAEGLHAKTVVVQLDGAGAEGLCADLECLGARVVRVPVYRWSTPIDLKPAERLIKAVVDRKVDGITFTAKPAVQNFFEIAEAMALGDGVTDALRSDVATFCVGPVCASPFLEHEITVPQVPEKHRLGALVQLVTKYFSEQQQALTIGGEPVVVKGRSLKVANLEEATLADRERAVLCVLLERPGAVVTKRDLLKRIWGNTESDEHLVEVAIARLRQRLGPAGAGIETVVRRGYRISSV